MAEVPDFTIRRMEKKDVPGSLEVWKQTHLQEGTECLYTWLEADPDCGRVAVTDSGEVLGTCTAVLHENGCLFLGTYAVLEKYRGCGIGIQVWNAVQERIGDRNTCINAVPDRIEQYRDKGNYPIMETEWSCSVNETTERVNYKVLSDALPKGVELQPFQNSNQRAVIEYDKSLMGYDRSVAVELNCKEKDSLTYVAMEDNRCVGYGTVKHSIQSAAQVGPLYADDYSTAEAILKSLTTNFYEKYPEIQGFAMMTVTNNLPANGLIKKIECPVFEECPRLYRKEKVLVDNSKVFAQFDLNFSPY